MDAASLLALAITCAPTVHPDTIHDIAKAESGFNPLAIAVVGGKSIYPSSVEDAITHVKQLKEKGENFSIGLMQINKVNFKKFGVTEKDLFNPCKNISIAEKLIVDCYERGGTLKRALSCYYSGNFETGFKKEKSFKNSSYVQRIGYIVPSTKEEISKQTQGKITDTTIIYPRKIIRGSINEPLNMNQQTKFPPNILRGELIASFENKEQK